MIVVRSNSFSSMLVTSFLLLYHIFPTLGQNYQVIVPGGGLQFSNDYNLPSSTTGPFSLSVSPLSSGEELTSSSVNILIWAMENFIVDAMTAKYHRTAILAFKQMSSLKTSDISYSVENQSDRRRTSSVAIVNFEPPQFYFDVEWGDTGPPKADVQAVVADALSSDSFQNALSGSSNPQISQIQQTSVVFIPTPGPTKPLTPSPTLTPSATPTLHPSSMKIIVDSNSNFVGDIVDENNEPQNAEEEDVPKEEVLDSEEITNNDERDENSTFDIELNPPQEYEEPEIEDIFDSSLTVENSEEENILTQAQTISEPIGNTGTNDMSLPVITGVAGFAFVGLVIITAMKVRHRMKHEDDFSLGEAPSDKSNQLGFQDSLGPRRGSSKSKVHRTADFGGNCNDFQSQRNNSRNYTLQKDMFYDVPSSKQGEHRSSSTFHRESIGDPRRVQPNRGSIVLQPSHFTPTDYDLEKVGSTTSFRSVDFDASDWDPDNCSLSDTEIDTDLDGFVQTNSRNDKTSLMSTSPPETSNHSILPYQLEMVDAEPEYESVVL